MDDHDIVVQSVKHPILWVDDLDQAAAWMEGVFGKPTLTTAEVMSFVEPRPGYRVDYGIFHLVQDTFIESIDPERLVIGGTNRFPRRGIPPVTVPSLGHFGWYVDRADALFDAIQDNGWHCQNQVGELSTEMAFGGKVGFPSFYALREEAGLAYQFVECPPSEENARKTADARLMPGWRLEAPGEDDGLGALLCSHHTVVTTKPERVLTLWLDILGGEVIYKGSNELLGADSTFVRLGDGVFECAVLGPAGLRVSGALNPEPYDSYHSMTFVVRDLERAEAHLAGQGVQIALRDDHTLVTDPATSLGVPWGFTTSMLPGDARARPSQGRDATA